ncbi:9245_t:CDS:10 [Acaulospora colombiana]|uniref:9245_t:CDS:1 n=1 Tax=Acaulospora colombiana TaxID=27376 RepID=A0ACA9LPD9_9GLOM|nr:9245_t:CDS:10 [Acaulospora colombiana]
MAQNKQALNVKDALSYLDQVKVQFSEQPEVYNRFLDIMKDFKSQTIDTPGVIERVSTLFKGHPALIQGFNTFLPPGYHIECSTNPHDPDSIRVTTPNGTTTTQIGPMETHHGQLSNIAGAGYYPNSGYPRPPPPSLMPTLTPHPPNTSLQMQVPYHMSSPQQSVGQSVAQQTIAQAVQSVGVGVTGSTSPQQQGKKAPVEFNHAINYVNKIKVSIQFEYVVLESVENRFSTEPDTYKEFLEILQTYQKDQRPIQEVYSQVQKLFKSAPDLLDQFKQFLPDTSGNVASGGLYPPQTHGTPKQSHLLPAISALTNNSSGPRLPPVGSFQSSASASLPAVNESYKKNSSGIGSTSHLSATGASSMSSSSVNKKKRSVLPNSERIPNPIPGKSKKSKTSHKTSGEQAHSSSSSMGLKVDSMKILEPQPLASTEELEFFEKVKRHISNKQSYNEFLKLLNLYSQQILDGKDLLKLMAPFLGGSNSELYAWLKQFLKLNERDEIVQNKANSRPRVDLEGCISHGPSYRKLPDSEAKLSCSGRDELCYEVLNDKWVSHPTWASEDAGFVSHKKNQFEEALHKCEEERYEYDMFIESVLHTIHLLEPIERKINTKLTPEERAKFKLEPGLGGKSMIYQRVIKKLYDIEKGLEVIDALHNNPCTVVPVVLKRLKQKDEEWKRARSLDHQGITFKNDDKKALTPKHLVAEIENLRREPTDDGEPAEYQFKFFFKDLDVFKDVARILFGFMDRSGTVAPNDREKIEKFFKTFVPSFFELPISIFDGINNDESVMLVDHEETTTNVSTDNNDGEPLSTEPISGMWIQVSKESRENIRAVVANAGCDKQKRRSTCYFFGNNSFYCFFRFLQMLFSRLESMKEAALEISSTTSQIRKQNVVASDLGLLPDRADIDIDIDLTRDPYSVMLDLIEKQFDGELELSTFEECLRYIYGTKAYIMFTVDKLVQNMTKQMQLLVSDAKSNSLINLFEDNKKQHDQSSVRSHIMYQLHANNTIGYDEPTYRIDYDKEEQAMTILLSGRDCTLGSAVTSEERWAYYMYSYMSLNPTEGVSSRTEKPFLKRNLPSVDVSEQIMSNVSTRNGLEIKICINSYHVFFVNNTEDSFRRINSSIPETKLKEDTEKRKEIWRRWLNSRPGDEMEI